MKSYNKKIALILSLGIMFSICSCSKKTEETTTTETTAEDTTVEETTVEETTVTETYIPDLTEDEKIDDEESSSNVTLKRIEGTDEPLLGFTDWYSERSVSDYGYTYWYYYNKDGEMIAMQFGWDCELESNIVLKDLDGDSLKEMISICTYPANRSNRILIYRNNNGVIEEGATTDEYLSEKFGNGSELDPTNCNEYYDYETGKIMLWIKDEDNTTVELTIDDFEFNEFPGV